MIRPRLIVGLAALLLAIVVALGFGAASVDRLAALNAHIARVPLDAASDAAIGEDLHAMAHEIWRLVVIERVLLLAGLLAAAAATWLTARALIGRVSEMTAVIPFR